MAARERSVPVERSGTNTERDAGSHSMDRIVRAIFLVTLKPRLIDSDFLDSLFGDCDAEFIGL